MKYAICNETFCDWPLDRALDYAVEAGYAGWEVAPFTLAEDIHEFSPAARRDYRKQVEAAGLEVIGLHWLLAKTNGYHLTTMDSATRDRTVAYLIELIKLCDDLGGQLMVLGSPQQRNLTEGQSMNEAMANAAEVLRSIVPALADHNVKIALEPLGPEEGNFLNTAADARSLQAEVDSDQIGLHLDVKAMSCESIPIPDLIRHHQDALLHFHANDPNRQGPGMGAVDFRPIFAALHEIDYGGWVSVEVFDYSPGIERLVSESMDNMLAAQTS